MLWGRKEDIFNEIFEFILNFIIIIVALFSASRSNFCCFIKVNNLVLGRQKCRGVSIFSYCVNKIIKIKQKLKLGKNQQKITVNNLTANFRHFSKQIKLFLGWFLQRDDLFSVRNGKVTDPLICLCKWRVQLLIWDSGWKGTRNMRNDINRFRVSSFKHNVKHEMVVWV